MKYWSQIFHFNLLDAVAKDVAVFLYTRRLKEKI